MWGKVKLVCETGVCTCPSLETGSSEGHYHEEGQTKTKPMMHSGSPGLLVKSTRFQVYHLEVYQVYHLEVCL